MQVVRGLLPPPLSLAAQIFERFKISAKVSRRIVRLIRQVSASSVEIVRENSYCTQQAALVGLERSRAAVVLDDVIWKRRAQKNLLSGSNIAKPATYAPSSSAAHQG